MIEDRSRQFHETLEKKLQQEQLLKYTKVRKLVKDFVVLDFETTGLSPVDNKIIQMAAVKYSYFEKIEEFVSYVNPEEPISSRITKITGIKNETVKDAPIIIDILPKLIEFIGNDTIIAHNASFDMKFLLTNMINCEIEYKDYRVIDTLQLARKLISDSKNHKLATLKEYLDLDHLLSHEALHDCYVTAELYKHCYKLSTIDESINNSRIGKWMILKLKLVKRHLVTKES